MAKARVKLIKNMAGPGIAGIAGEELVIDADLAKQLLDAGAVVLLGELPADYKELVVEGPQYNATEGLLRFSAELGRANG